MHLDIQANADAQRVTLTFEGLVTEALPEEQVIAMQMMIVRAADPIYLTINCSELDGRLEDVLAFLYYINRMLTAHGDLAVALYATAPVFVAQRPVVAAIRGGGTAWMTIFDAADEAARHVEDHIQHNQSRVA